MRRKTIFMTGAGGGMGHESFRQMLPDLGKIYNLVILVRDSEKNHKLFDSYQDQEGLTIVYGDLLIQEDVEKCIAMSDMVLHIAALVSPVADYYPEKAMKNNYGSCVNMISAIKKLYSVGVQASTALNAPRGCARIRTGICLLKQTRIRRARLASES